MSMEQIFAKPISLEGRQFATFLLSPSNRFERNPTLSEEKVFRLAEKAIRSLSSLSPGEVLPRRIASRKRGEKDALHIRLCGPDVEGMAVEMEEGKRLGFFSKTLPSGKGASNDVFDAYASPIGEVVLRILRSPDKEGIEKWQGEVRRHREMDFPHAIHFHGAFIQSRRLEGVGQRREIADLPRIIRLQGLFSKDEKIPLVGMVLEPCLFNLGDFLDREMLTSSEKKHLIRGLLEAGKELHERRYYHGDLNLGNVLVKRNEKGKWEIKIADFEFAKQFDEKPTLEGSPLYWPPEAFRWEKGKSGEKIDAFAIGKLCLEIQEGPVEKNPKHWLERYGTTVLKFFSGAQFLFLAIEDADSSAFREEVKKKYGEAFKDSEVETLAVSEIWRKIKRLEGALSLKESKRKIIGGEVVQEWMLSEWKKTYPKFANGEKATALSCYHSLVDEIFIPNAMKLLGPFIEKLERSDDPLDFVIGKLLNPDFERRITLQEAFKEFTRTL